MRSNLPATALAVVVGVVVGSGLAAAQAPNMAHTHIGHVMTSFGDTPDKAGLLPTASAEAATAAQHAALGAKASTNLMAMQLHAGHVIQCIDPAIVAMGPCRGYGVKKAATAAMNHIGMAAKADTASAGVKTHTTHVTTALDNTIKRADAVVAAAEKVRAATTAEQAAPLAAELQKLAGQLSAGVDANGDGQIGWQAGEGGLAAATTHMQLMMKGENIQ
jgi:hypothetical protein